MGFESITFEVLNAWTWRPPPRNTNCARRYLVLCEPRVASGTLHIGIPFEALFFMTNFTLFLALLFVPWKFWNPNQKELVIWHSFRSSKTLLYNFRAKLRCQLRMFVGKCNFRWQKYEMQHVERQTQNSSQSVRVTASYGYLRPELSRLDIPASGMRRLDKSRRPGTWLTFCAFPPFIMLIAS